METTWDTDVNIYILKLDNGRYLIHHTEEYLTDYDLCSIDHSWIKESINIEVMEKLPNRNPKLVNEIVIHCMHRFGIDLVRGGKYSQYENISLDERNILKQKIIKTHGFYEEPDIEEEAEEVKVKNIA